ncbi:MAG: ribonuclease III [Clostridia bacterium]|nr:ribonuclease III [Clostridia bacterium]
MYNNIFPDERFSLFEERIGYLFKNKKLLRAALTHSSFANEMKSRGVTVPCNERLEFLGDSVISLITAHYIFDLYPKENEGDLTKLRSLAVRDIALSEYARELGMGECLMLGRGEDNPEGRGRRSTLENAFEALTGAIYLDGGLEAATAFVRPFIERKVHSTVASGENRDYKTILQQIVQMEQGERLEYVLVGESGPDHCKQFEVEAHLNHNVIGRGVGPRKIAAEQMAAKEALGYFGYPDCFRDKKAK